MATNSELRRRAREQLGSNIFNSTWLYLILAAIIVSALISVSGVIAIGPILLLGPLSFGLSRVFVKLVRGQKAIDLVNLFDGFKEDFGQTCLLGILSELFIFLWSLLFIIPGIVKSYSYSMAFYIQQDSENKDWSTCLTESRKMMNGHKWKLFLLDLSFIGWYIVGSLLCGVGTLWVAAYAGAARANFYEELRAKQNPEVIL